MMRAWQILGVLGALLCPAFCAAENDINAFITQAFAPHTAQAEVLWLTPPIKQAAQAATGMVPEGARLRYWRNGLRTAWVLNRIGKEEPITFGVVVENNAIVALQVITYRESRGHEIRTPRWLAQFVGARAADTSAHALNRHIDNITGATLSVRAGMDVARLALFLHQQVVRNAK